MSVLLIAGSGGHLTQLKILADRIPAAESRIWITDRTPQSESLLENERVVFVPHQAPRSVLGLIRNAWLILRIMDSSITGVYSTGAGIALSGLLAAYVKNRKFTYIESATRVTSLSLTGKVINWLPKVSRFVQHERLAGGRWLHSGSVFEGFSRVETVENMDTSSLRVFVTVGANQHAGFERMIRELYELIPAHWSSYWQYGPTDVRGLKIDGSKTLSAKDMMRQLELADVIVSHAGTGSILSSLMAGKIPIVVPRAANEGEHVDEHQVDLANFAAANDLAIVRQVGELSTADLVAASRLAAKRADRLGDLGV